MLRIENASLSLSSTKTLFRNLNVHVKAGEILQIVGPNGIGKSSLLRAIAGLTPLSAGYVHCSSERVYLPQLANLSFHINLTIRDVLKLMLFKDYVESSVLELGFLDFPSLDLCWNSASGGERQRTLLSWVFLCSAQILLLDEPMNHLDKERSGRVLAAMNESVMRKEKAIVFVSHQSIFDFPSATILNLGDFVQ